MTHDQIITEFYTAFSEKDAQKMTAFYHNDITFEDPAFGKLHGNDAKNMWGMLLDRMDESASISFTNVKGTKEGGSASWKASYPYGKNKRKVINHIQAKFKIQDGYIIDHQDSFSMWNWSRQALGLPGLLLGWTPFIKKKVQRTTNALLKQYTDNK